MKKSENKAPDHLSTEARSWWGRLMTEYDLGDTAGQLLLQSALEAFDRMREAQENIKEHGAVYLDRYGQPKNNPATVIERDSRSQMLAALKQLNLDLEPLRDGAGRPPGAMNNAD